MKIYEAVFIKLIWIFLNINQLQPDKWRNLMVQFVWMLLLFMTALKSYTIEHHCLTAR